MNCALCEKKITGSKHRIPLWEGGSVTVTHVCERCWNKHDNLSEEIMAKKKAAKKAKKGKDAKGRSWPEVKPCEKCGRTDFENDFKRRGHQGKCQGKNPPPKVEKPAKKKGKKGRKKGTKSSKPRIKTPPPKVDQDTGAKRTRQQVGRMSKAKGNKFENVVKKALATWWGEPPEIVGSKDSAFQRAPGSGGTSPKNWPLDIHVPPDFPWAIECKNREGFDGMEAMERFFTSDYSVVRWFRLGEKELHEAGIQKPLLLVFTRNQYPNFAAIRRPGCGQDMFVPPFSFMTLVHFPTDKFGYDVELMVAKLDDILRMDRQQWAAVYAANDPRSYMPKG